MDYYTEQAYGVEFPELSDDGCGYVNVYDVDKAINGQVKMIDEWRNLIVHDVHAINYQDDIPLENITYNKNKSFVESINCHDEPLYYGACIVCNDKGDKLFLRTMTGDMIGESFIHIGIEIDDPITGLTDAQRDLRTIIARNIIREHRNSLNTNSAIESNVCMIAYESSRRHSIFL